MLVDDMQQVALDEINNYGSDVELKKKDSNNYNPATSENETVEGATFNLKALFEAYSSDEIDGLIQVGDVRLMVAYKDTVTYDIANDIIIFKNTKYNIVNIQPMFLQNKIVYYILQLRK
ncbi:MAG: hypothetical protein JJV88_01530 [Sulfurovum sp.]|nr:hypothetical protein [Sulfurovaceae bacterium]